MEENKLKIYFWFLLDIFILGLIVNLIFFVMPTIRKFGNSLVSTHAVSVSAEGKTTVTPDLAESSFSVVSRGSSPQQLVDDNDRKISVLIKFLKSEELSDKDIKTTGYNLSPDYRYDQKTGESSITGYTLTQTVGVKMRDFKKVPEIVGGLTPLGVNQIGGITFTVEDPEKFLVIARSEAFKKARVKATEMVAENGARLGRILNIGESGGGLPIPYLQSMRALGAAGPSPVAPPTIEPGTQEIKDMVTLTYELE